jgi:hypothetical protein
MDEVLILVLKYKQIHNHQIIENDTFFYSIDLPINGWMRINTWRTYDNVNPLEIEIDYSVLEYNTTPRNYTCRMESTEFMRRIEINR